MGVSAQQAASDGGTPKSADPARYAPLSHPGDSYSYDIFSQAGQAIRDDSAQILGGRSPRTLLAAGESQSAARMVTYIDAVQPLVHEYDGFLVHSRGAAGSALSQFTVPATPPDPTVQPPSPTLIRTDLHTPVFVFQTEFDISGAFTARQPDTNVFRQWEAAGTSHFDTYGLLIGPSDTGNGQGAVANLAAMQDPTNIPGPGGQCTEPINTGGAHWLLDSAIFWLNQWVTQGHAASARAAPADRVDVAVCLRQGHQRQHHRWRALTAGRRPDRDARGYRQHCRKDSSPISLFCVLFGSTVPYTAAQLSSLYPTHLQFVLKWDAATLKDVLHGFILPADAIELANSAAASQIK